MKNKIKNYFATPLTKGWLWKWTAISFFLSACFAIGISGVDFKQLFKPSDDWEDIPEEE